MTSTSPQPASFRPRPPVSAIASATSNGRLLPFGGGWALSAGLVAAVVALPLLAVLTAWRAPASDVWLHLWQTTLPEILWNTLTLLIGVAVGTVVLGTGLAWLVTAYRFPGRAVFEWALVLPLALPAYVIGFVFLGIFDFAGPTQAALRRLLGAGARLPDLHGWWGVTLMMTLVFYPYVYLLARVTFREQAVGLMEAARSLGRTGFGAFLAVALPLARPAIAAGGALAMMEALADLGTVSLFGHRTLTEAVYRTWAGMFDRVAAAQLASLLLVVAFTLLTLERALRGRRRFVDRPRVDRRLPSLPLTGLRAALATATCAAVVGLAFAVPVAQLVVWAVQRADAGIPGGFAGLVTDTAWLAAVAAVVICVAGLVLAYARRLAPSPVTRAAVQFASLGYALPGAVIAVGVLGPVAHVDRALGRLLSAVGLGDGGAILTGSVVAVVFAYLVRFLAVAVQGLDAALLRIPRTLDEAARSLGVAGVRLLRRVHLPLLRGGVLTTALLLWVETMKELPATLLLRPIGLKTLAIEVWERTGESLWEEAALPALALVAVGLVPLLVVTRMTSGRPR